MAFGAFVLVALLCLVIIGYVMPVSVADSNSGICTVSSRETVIVYYTTNTPCGDMSESFDCKENRSVYEAQNSSSEQFVYFVKSQCCKGYKEVSSSPLNCIDFPECSEGVAECSHICIELPGSYECECYPEYSLNEDGYSCNPICESGCYHGNCYAPDKCTCEEGWNGFTCDTAICRSGCQHGNCSGPDDCTCHVGWTGGICDKDENECNMQNGGCAHECVNTNGSYYCKCASGYNLTEDSHRCQDLSECSTGQAQCSHNCTELPGSYNCSCYDGYSLDNDGYSCNAICESGCYHGNCTTPDNCTCDFGWKGMTCNSALCQPGTYSDSGLEPCEECPPNYYQLNYGSSYCDPCDNYNITDSVDEFCVMPTPTKEQSSHSTIIGLVTGVIAVIAIVTSILMATAIACDNYAKQKKTLKCHSEGDLEANNCDESRGKGNSRHYEETLEMKELEDDSSICKPSCFHKAPSHNSTIDEKHTSAVTTTISFECEGEQTSKAKHELPIKQLPFPSKVSKPVYESKGNGTDLNNLTSTQKHTVPPKPLPENSQKPTHTLNTRQDETAHMKTPHELPTKAQLELESEQPEKSSGFKAPTYQNNGGKPPSKALVPVQETATDLKPQSQIAPNTFPSVPSAQPWKTKQVILRMGANEPPEQLPYVHDKQDLKDGNSTKRLSSAFLSPVDYVSVKKPHSTPKSKPLPKPISTKTLFPSSTSSSSSSPSDTNQSHPCVQMRSISLWNAETQKKKDRKVSESTRKCSSAFDPFVYCRSSGDIHPSTLISHKEASTPIPKPRYLPKPASDVPPKKVQKIPSNNFTPEHSSSSSTMKTNQQDQISNAISKSLKSHEQMEQKDSRSTDSTTELSSSFHFPTYNSSASQPNSCQLMNCKDDLVPQSRLRTLLNPSDDAVLTQLPNGLTNAHATKPSVSQSACQNGQKDQIDNSHCSSYKDASKKEENKEMYNQPSGANTAHQLTAPQRRKAEIPPQPLPTPPPRKLSGPQAKALPSKSSPGSSLATQNHEQDDHIDVQVYDRLLSFSNNPNQQASSSKWDGYPNSSHVSDEYDHIDSQMNQSEKSHSSARAAHLLTLPQRQKPKLPPKPTLNPPLKKQLHSHKKALPSSFSPASQKKAQDPHLPFEISDQSFPFSTSRDKKTPSTEEMEHIRFVVVAEDTSNQTSTGWRNRPHYSQVVKCSKLSTTSNT